MIAPSVSDFKSQFIRDFPYGTTTDKVMDADITRALSEASYGINEGLFAQQTEFTSAYLYLAAHNLVMALRASSQGVNGSFAWLETSKAVGSVSQGFQIPQWILDHPLLSLLSKTTYGAMYLAITLPKLVAPIFSSEGASQA